MCLGATLSTVLKITRLRERERPCHLVWFLCLFAVVGGCFKPISICQESTGSEGTEVAVCSPVISCFCAPLLAGFE